MQEEYDEWTYAVTCSVCGAEMDEDPAEADVYVCFRCGNIYYEE